MAAEDVDKMYIDGVPRVNVLSFKYLGSFQEQDATTDQAILCFFFIRVRLAQSRARFNQMYHVWIDKAMHGSEAWDLTPANLKMIRAWNTGCLGTTTGRAHHKEG